MDAPEREWVWLARIRRPQGRKGEVFADILTDFPEKFADRRCVWLLPPANENLLGSGQPPSRGKVSTQASSPAFPDTSARPVELIHHWLHKGGVVLHFAGISSISDAEELSGAIVALPKDERAPLANDEVYIGDLIGCKLVDVAHPQDARAIGVIENVDREAGPVPLLIVRGANGEILIPFAKKYLRRLDLVTRRVEMELPEGLVELNN
jgi:16S rRNA processing protein RimM